MVGCIVAALLASGIMVGEATGAAADGAEEQFVFCYENTELYPHFVGNTSKVPEFSPGISVDMVKLIAERANLVASFVRYPWKRCLSLLAAGRVDGVIASFSADRMTVCRYPMKENLPDKERRISTAGYYVYQLAQREPVWDGVSFESSQVMIGAPLGYSIVADLKKQQVNVIEAGSTDGLLTLLLRGRIDAAAAPGLATNSALKRGEDKFSAIVRLDHPLKVKPYYLVLSHQFASTDETVAENLWEAVRIVRENAGELIARQY